MKKLVVVAGASSGIGMELAKRFSGQGHPVLMLARRSDIMEKLELPNTTAVLSMLRISRGWNLQSEKRKLSTEKLTFSSIVQD